MNISRKLRKEISDFLIYLPGLQDAEGQRAFIYRAGLDSQLQVQLPFGKPQAQFIQLIIPLLVDYGKLENGQYAIEAILEAAKEYIGQNRRDYCNILIQKFRINMNEVAQSDKKTYFSIPIVRIGIPSMTIFFVIVGIIFYFEWFHKKIINSNPIHQHTQGNQSPIINNTQGDVVLKYESISSKEYEWLLLQLNNNQRLVDRLLSTIEKKDITIERRDEVIQQWIEKYKSLEYRLTTTDNNTFLSGKVNNLLQDGDLERAEQLLIESLEQNLIELEHTHHTAAANAFTLANIKYLQLDYKQAQVYFEQAVNLEPQNGLYLNELGFLLNNTGEYNKAIEYFEKALSILKNEPEIDYPNIASILDNIGTAWYRLGEYSKAIEFHEQALEIEHKIYNTPNENIAKTLSNIGSVWSSLGEYCKAISFYEQAMEIFEKVHGKKHPTIAITFNNLGVLYWDSGEFEKAIGCYKQAVEIYKEVYGEWHPDTVLVTSNLAMSWASLGENYKAIESIILPKNWTAYEGVKYADFDQEKRRNVMGSSRKNYPAALKVKVALAALKGDKTLAQLSSEFGVHTNQIQEWKKRLLAEAPAIFSPRRSHAERDAEELQAELYRQIGQLKVELDWLKKRVETSH